MRPITASAVECVSFVSIEMATAPGSAAAPRTRARSRRRHCAARPSKRPRSAEPERTTKNVTRLVFRLRSIDAGRDGGIPHIPDQTGAQEGRRPRPGDQHVAREVRSLRLADVRAVGQLHRLPAPLEDRRRAQVDVHLLRDRGMLVAAPEPERPHAVLAHDREVVARASARRLVLLPSGRNARRADGLLAPVLDEAHPVDGAGRGRAEETEGQQAQKRSVFSCPHASPRATRHKRRSAVRGDMKSRCG